MTHVARSSISARPSAGWGGSRAFSDVPAEGSDSSKRTSERAGSIVHLDKGQLGSVQENRPAGAPAREPERKEQERRVRS